MEQASLLELTCSDAKIDRRAFLALGGKSLLALSFLAGCRAIPQPAATPAKETKKRTKKLQSTLNHKLPDKKHTYTLSTKVHDGKLTVQKTSSDNMSIYRLEGSLKKSGLGRILGSVANIPQMELSGRSLYEGDTLITYIFNGREPGNKYGEIVITCTRLREGVYRYHQAKWKKKIWFQVGKDGKFIKKKEWVNEKVSRTIFVPSDATLFDANQMLYAVLFSEGMEKLVHSEVEYTAPAVRRDRKGIELEKISLKSESSLLTVKAPSFLGKDNPLKIFYRAGKLYVSRFNLDKVRSKKRKRTCSIRGNYSNGTLEKAEVYIPKGTITIKRTQNKQH